MANPQHLKILRQGVDTWNKWRVGNPGLVPDLARADLHAADLGGAALNGTNLQRSNLVKANLTWANLAKAHLEGADLRQASLVLSTLFGANLYGAHLSRANLRAANLFAAKLRGADLTGAILAMANLAFAGLGEANFSHVTIGYTTFGNSDLSTAEGLETVHHEGPSAIGIDMIYNSKGNIPEVFLRGCGVPEDFVTYIKSLVGNPIEFYSCFISYSTKDGDFAQRLFADLQAKNVRCWKFDESAKWGEPAWGEIDTAIKHYDKLVVICSKDSLQSVPVIREIERALQKEDREHRNVLFPIRIDDYLFDEWEHPRKPDVVSKVAGDFRGWTDHAKYSKAFPRFLEALNRPQQAARYQSGQL